MNATMFPLIRLPDPLLQCFTSLLSKSITGRRRQRRARSRYAAAGAASAAADVCGRFIIGGGYRFERRRRRCVIGLSDERWGGKVHLVVSDGMYYSRLSSSWVHALNDQAAESSPRSKYCRYVFEPSETKPLSTSSALTLASATVTPTLLSLRRWFQRLY